MYVQVTNDGTAMAETALCDEHYLSDEYRGEFGLDRDSENGEPLKDTAFHYTSENEALECGVCGHQETGLICVLCKALGLGHDGDHLVP